jgi:hypothetical protein
VRAACVAGARVEARMVAEAGGGEERPLGSDPDHGSCGGGGGGGGGGGR